MEKLGYTKTWMHCRTKVKNLTAHYRKAKDGNKVSGGKRLCCNFYNEIDEILGTRAASAPPLLVENATTRNCDTCDSSAEAAHGSTSTSPTDDTPAPPSPTQEEIDQISGDEEAEVPPASQDEVREEESAPSTSSGSRPTGNSKNTKKKYTKRKREGISTDVLEVLGELEERADKRWFTMEEKRMKLEAELEEKRRCEERNHELRMQKLMMGCMQQMFTNFAPHPPMYSHQAPFPHRTPTAPPNPIQSPPPSSHLHTTPTNPLCTTPTNPLRTPPPSTPFTPIDFYSYAQVDTNSEDEF